MLWLCVWYAYMCSCSRVCGCTCVHVYVRPGFWGDNVSSLIACHFICWSRASHWTQSSPLLTGLACSLFWGPVCFTSAGIPSGHHTGSFTGLGDLNAGPHTGREVLYLVTPLPSPKLSLLASGLTDHLRSRSIFYLWLPFFPFLAFRCAFLLSGMRIDPRDLDMLDMCSSAALCPQPCHVSF